MGKIRGFGKKARQFGRGLCAGGMAFLLMVMFLFPVMPVYAEENLYEVQAGDCLWKIAERFLGDGARYADLVAWNGEQIQDPNLIYPGMVLRIMADEEVDTNTDKDTEQSAKQNTSTNTGNTDADKETDPDTDMQDTSAETLEDMSIFGTINGSSWENAWLEMRFNAPEGFRLAPAEEYFDDLDEDEDDDDLLVYVEFVAESTEYFGTTAFFALGQSEDTPEEYMEEVKPIAEEAFKEGLDVDLEWSTEGTVEFGGRAFEHYVALSELLGYEISQDYYITKQEDIICFFYILSIDGMTEEPGILLEGFSEYSDNSGDGDLRTEARQENAETDEDTDKDTGNNTGNKAGRDLILTATLKSCEKDGTITNTTVYKYEYDEEGNRIRCTEYSGDGNVKQWYTYEYDGKGNMTKETFTVEYMDVWETHIYKEDGELLMLLQDGEDRPGNGAEAWTYKWEYEYNEHDNVVSKLYETPEGEHELTTYEYEYDAAGNVVKETSYLTDPDDEEDKELTEWTEYGYDKDNRMTENVTYNSKGEVKHRTTVEYTYDAEGNMTMTTRSGEDGAMMWFTTNREEIMIDGGYRSSSDEEPDMISEYEFDEKGNYSRITDHFRNGNTYYAIWEYEYVTI